MFQDLFSVRKLFCCLQCLFTTKSASRNTVIHVSVDMHLYSYIQNASHTQIFLGCISVNRASGFYITSTFRFTT